MSQSHGHHLCIPQSLPSAHNSLHPSPTAFTVFVFSTFCSLSSHLSYPVYIVTHFSCFHYYYFLPSYFNHFYTPLFLQYDIHTSFPPKLDNAHSTYPKPQLAKRRGQELCRKKTQLWLKMTLKEQIATVKTIVVDACAAKFPTGPPLLNLSTFRLKTPLHKY